MEKKKSDREDSNEMINSAIEYGLGVLAEDHPQFPQEYIQRHINKRLLIEKIRYISEELKKGDLSEDQQREYLHRELADYVATGGALDDKAKKAVLKGSLEERTKFFYPIKKLFTRGKLKGEENFNNTVEAFRDLYSLIKTGDYAQRMPELAQAIQEVYDNGFFDPAIDILNSYGFMDKGKYNLIKKNIRKKTEGTSKAVVKGIGDYFTKQTAAIILGLVGALMVFTSANMTGGVIGALGSDNIKIVGAFLFLIALVLFLKIVRKKRKSKTFKNR